MIGPFLRDRHGNVALVLGLTAPVLVTVVGAAVDYSRLSARHADLQRVADDAALSAAKTLSTNEALAPSQREAAALQTAHQITSAEAPKAESTPRVLLDENAVRVALSETVDVAFGAFLGRSAALVSRVSKARYSASSGGPCVMLRDPSASAALDLGGAAKLTVNCGLQINSSSPTAASRSGAASIRTGNACIVGGSNTTSGWSPPPSTKCPVAADPLAALPEPAAPGKTCLAPVSSGTMTPDCLYTGVIALSGNVQMPKGMYYFKNATVSLGSNATLSGAEVTLFLDAGSTLALGGGGAANLSAPTTGPYQGILVFQSRSTPVATALSLGGNGSLHLNGAIYAPSITLELTGNASFDSKLGFVIAARMRAGGSSSFTINAFGAAGVNPQAMKPGTTLSLVQ